MRPVAAGSTRTRAVRRIAADPTSTALLLAGPAAMDLWPDLRRVGRPGGRELVEARLPVAGTAEAAVRALPTQRTALSYVTRFEFRGPRVAETTGELVLGYAPGGGRRATSAVLVLDSSDSADSALTPAALQEMADGFLANLARAAESRNRAA